MAIVEFRISVEFDEEPSGKVLGEILSNLEKVIGMAGLTLDDSTWDSLK